MSQATADSASRATSPVVDRPNARSAPRASDETPALVSRDSELEELRSRLDACQMHLDLVLTSTSWRVMAPLRLSVGLLRGEPAYRARLSQLLQRISLSRWLRISRGLLRGDPLYRQELETRLRRIRTLGSRPGRESTVETETPASCLTDDVAADEPVRTRIVYVSGEPRTPGHRYRVERYAAAARSAGAEVLVVDVEDAAAQLDTIAAAQVLVIWRAIWSDPMARIIIAARGAGARIIFDVDDLMIDPEVATLELIDGIRTQGLAASAVRDHYARMREVALAADLCTCPTEPLAEMLRGLGKPTLVLRNGYDSEIYERARSAVIARRSQGEMDLIRLGYAAGTRTHQRDFRIAAPAVAFILREYPQTRLVLFHDGPNPESSRRTLDLAEFSEFAELEEQIEWRPMVALEDLPSELARFDINLAPLEVGNPYCEAKSELKFFEAALVDVPTVASPTAPFRAAIEQGRTGYLAASTDEWVDALVLLVKDPRRRHEMAREALNGVLWRYGPEARADRMRLLLEWGRGAVVDPTSARRNDLGRIRVEHDARPSIPPHDVVFLKERATLAEVAVIVPLYNYTHFVEQALESVKAQTLPAIELVVIDDCSTDDSLAVARRWLEGNAARFQRVALLRNRQNSFLGSARNAAIAFAEAPFVMPLDPDNLLLPECLETCIGALRPSLAAMAHPLIQQIGDSAHIMGTEPWSAERLRHGNYIDAMALLRKSAWAAVGGYENLYGWEDYDLWCKFVERGFWGLQVAEVLALYRVHENSMLRTHTHRNEVERKLYREVCRRHPWLDRESLRLPLSSLSDADAALIDAETPDASAERTTPPLDSEALQATGITPDDRLARLAVLIDLLRCPLSGERLRPSETGEQLISEKGRHVWPVLDGRPILFDGLDEVTRHPVSHRSNSLCERASALIAETRGPVLNLSAGGSANRKHHVIEVEAALFCNTDAVADAHHLPFADACFELVIAMNAFEHYADPARVAREIHRVLVPGGRVFIHTAFLQPLHEPPYHFYNCTRYGLARWFADFDALDLRVSDNFTAGYAISWLLSETEALLRAEISGSVADAFMSARVGKLLDWWRHPPSRDDPVWRSLAALPQRAQEQVAAGFEYLGRKG